MLVKSLELPSNFLNAQTLHGAHWVGRGQLPSESLCENQALYAWNDGKNRYNFASTPTQQAGACRVLLEKSVSSRPRPPTLHLKFSNTKHEVPLSPDQLRSPGTAVPVPQERDLRSHSWLATGLVVGACGPTRPQLVTSRPPTSCVIEKEPDGSFPFYHPWWSSVLIFWWIPFYRPPFPEWSLHYQPPSHFVKASRLAPFLSAPWPRWLIAGCFFFATPSKKVSWLDQCERPLFQWWQSIPSWCINRLHPVCKSDHYQTEQWH